MSWPYPFRDSFGLKDGASNQGDAISFLGKQNKIWRKKGHFLEKMGRFPIRAKKNSKKNRVGSRGISKEQQPFLFDSMSIGKPDTARFSRIFVPRGKGKKRSEKFGSRKKREACRSENSQKIFGELFFE